MYIFVLENLTNALRILIYELFLETFYEKIDKLFFLEKLDQEAWEFIQTY